MYKKKGFPQEGEILLCTVKKILPHSVFVNLDEYIDKEGLIHISEISPGRIRTLSDFVKEGKKIICKVLKVDKEKGHIDLSLRRVTTSVKVNKLTEIKQEEKSEKLLKLTGLKLKKTLQEMYKEVGYNILEQYGSLNQFFQDISKDKAPEIEIPKKTLEIITEIVKEKIKPQELKISGSLTLMDFKPNGIENIKKALLSTAEDKNIKIRYTSAPKYRVEVTSTDYKTAENILKNIVDKIIKEITKLGGTGEFQKDG